MNKPNLLADALGYLARGISVIPMRLRGDEKKPAIAYKRYLTRLPLRSDLEEWFTKRRGVNGVAVLTGPQSGGLAIRDFDTVSGYEQFKIAHPKLWRELPTVRTKRGYHVWFKSDLSKTKKLADGEYRGFGVCVAPHSVRGTFQYQWVIPLPKGELRFVEHSMFTGKRVTERDRDGQRPTEMASVSLCNASVDEIIAKTLPSSQGQRNECLLALARGLKFNAGLSNATIKALTPIVKRWFERALPYIDTKDFEITLCDFEHAYTQARHPLGLDLVDRAALQIDPDDLCATALTYEGPTTRKLVSLCYELSKVNSGAFFLSCHDAAPRLGITPTQVWRLLRMLEQDGVLKCLQRGDERRATRYLWIGRSAQNEIRD